jgi:hypothetical protein
VDKDRKKNVTDEIYSFSKTEYVSSATTIKQDDLLNIFNGTRSRTQECRLQEAATVLTDPALRDSPRQAKGV